MKKALASLALGAAVGGCAALHPTADAGDNAGGDPAMHRHIEQIAAKSQCGRVEATPALTLLRNAEELADALEDKAVFGKPKVIPPAVDFGAETVVLVQLGQRPNAGYGLELTATEATLEGAELALPVAERSPDPAMMHASVITAPCLVLRFKSEGVETISALGLRIDGS